MVKLEESIAQAQNREGQILDMTQWMTEMNDLLQSRLDADILAGDVPDEYEVDTHWLLLVSCDVFTDERIDWLTFLLSCDFSESLVSLTDTSFQGGRLCQILRF